MRRLLLTPWPLVLAIAACGPRQQTALGVVPPGTVVDLREETYDVTGTSVGELGEQMDAQRWYRFDWRLDWRYGYREVPAASLGNASETACGTHDIRLTLEFTSRLPRWIPTEDAPPELGARWDRYMAGVKAFGEGYRDIAMSAVREVHRRLGDLRTENCAFMEREARRLVDGIIERHNERSREYYRVTERVPWPPRVGS